MASKLEGNGNTLSKIVQKIEDHVIEQDKQFNGVDKRLDGIEKEVKCLIEVRGTKTADAVRFWVPIIVMILIAGGGWLYGLSRQEGKIAELENGRHENKGNIQILMNQTNDLVTKMAVRDERYQAILEKLEDIQKQLDKIQRTRLSVK